VAAAAARPNPAAAPPSVAAAAARPNPAAADTAKAASRESVAAPASVAAPPSAAAARVHVLSDPPGADVVLDGRSLGPTPLDVTAPEGSDAFWIELRLPGHETRRVRLRAADPTPAAITLRRLPRIED
jgi:hypothetical protein